MTTRKRQHNADPVALVTAGALVLICAALLTSDRAAPRPATRSAPAQAALTNGVILDSFARIALEREYEPERDPGIAKWAAPIRVRVVALAPVDDRTLALVERQLATLSALTGLSLDRVADRAPANFSIVFTSRDRFADQVRASLTASAQPVAARLIGANCVGLFEQAVASRAIVRATVIIPLDHARARGLLERCIVEEMTQVMGLPNDARLPAPSVFDDTGDARALTPLDRALVRLLYRPELRPGMRRAEALAAARGALARLRGAETRPHAGR